MTSNAVATLHLKPNRPVRPSAPGQTDFEIQNGNAGRTPFINYGRHGTGEAQSSDCDRRARPYYD